MKGEEARRSVVRVGDGRGFVVQGPRYQKLVVTAGHCLPFFPPCHGASYLEERTYQRLLGPLGAEPTVGPSVSSLTRLLTSPCSALSMARSFTTRLWPMTNS